MKPDSTDLHGSVRTLTEAAESLGCHVETLRRRIREGELRAIRGPHGRYLVSEAQLAQVWVQPRPGRRPRLDEEGSWAALAQLVYQYRQTHDEALALLEQVRRDPARRPRFARLVEVQRLRLIGFAFADIARQLKISERHAHRLGHGNLEIGLRVELMRLRDHGLSQARRNPRPLLLALEERLRRAGYTGLGRAEIAAAWPRRIGALHRRLSLEHRRILRTAGLTQEEIEAIESGGLPSEGLEYLLRHGLGPADPAGHTTQGNDEAR